MYENPFQMNNQIWMNMMNNNFNFNMNNPNFINNMNQIPNQINPLMNMNMIEQMNYFNLNQRIIELENIIKKKDKQIAKLKEKLAKTLHLVIYILQIEMKQMMKMNIRYIKI